MPDSENKIIKSARCRYLHFDWISVLLFSIFLIIIGFFSCKKENPENTPPEISLITDSGYITCDTILNPGTLVKVGIEASGVSGNITYLNVLYNDGAIHTALDSGMNCKTLQYSRNIIKSNSQSETWTFTVMDVNRLKAGITITLTKANIVIYGNIISYTDIILGAQQNNNNGSFFSLSGGTVYFQEEAFNNQNLVDIIYYFGSYESTLSSPAETEAPAFFPGTTGIANWTIKNETKYDTTTITAIQFDQAINDSLLLAAYEPANGKRKTKYLEPGMVISFQDHRGKIGLIKVIATEGGNNGVVELTIKVQE
jgi:hypothetical protein